MFDDFKKQLSSQDQLSLLDLVFFSAYESKIGFRYNVEALMGLQDLKGKLW